VVHQECGVPRCRSCPTGREIECRRAADTMSSGHRLPSQIEAIYREPSAVAGHIELRPTSDPSRRAYSLPAHMAYRGRAERNRLRHGRTERSAVGRARHGIWVPANSRKAGSYTILQRLTRPAHKAGAESRPSLPQRVTQNLSRRITATARSPVRLSAIRSGVP
jgi:hypothetical protein